MKLGEKYRDTVTGFVGAATSRHEYLNGCVRYCLEALDKDGSIQELHFDEERLEPLFPDAKAQAGTASLVSSSKTGGARPAAPRTGAR